MSQLDSIDNKIFEVAVLLADFSQLNIDKMDHTALVINIREAIINELQEQEKLVTSH